jgi:hypothetical protein
MKFAEDSPEYRNVILFIPPKTAGNLKICKKRSVLCDVWDEGCHTKQLTYYEKIISAPAVLGHGVVQLRPLRAGGWDDCHQRASLAKEAGVADFPIAAAPALYAARNHLPPRQGQD